MSEERKALLYRIYSEAYQAGELGVLDEAYTDGYVRHQPPVPSVEGLEDYKQFIQDTRSAYTGLEFNIQEIIVQGDCSATRLILRGKHTGQAPTILTPPTGKEIEMAGCIVSHWEGDKIAVDWVYNDYLGLVQQFGMYPPPGMFA